MLIRPNFGQLAGEVQDFRADVARELIAQGRATDPRFDEVQTPATLVGERAGEAILPAAVAQDLARRVSRSHRSR